MNAPTPRWYQAFQSQGQGLSLFQSIGLFSWLSLTTLMGLFSVSALGWWLFSIAISVGWYAYTHRKTWRTAWQRYSPLKVCLVLLGLIPLGILSGFSFFAIVDMRNRLDDSTILFGEFSAVQKAMGEAPGEAQAGQGFEHLSQERQQWCTQALTRLDTFTTMVLQPERRQRIMAGGMASALSNRAFAEGCLSDAQWVKQRESIDVQVRSHEGPDQRRLSSLAWLPLFHQIHQVETKMLDTLTLTPQKACLMLATAQAQRQQCEERTNATGTATAQDLVFIRSNVLPNPYR